MINCDRGVSMKFKKWPFYLGLLIIFVINSGFLVVGHRGDPSKYPEETIQSDNSAFESGADYVELDLHLSKDNVLIVSHDDDLSRVVGSSVIVSQNTFQTLSQYKYRNGEHVLSLDQLFDYYKDKPNTKFVLETKVDHGVDKSNKLEKKLAECIKRHHMEKRVMIHSFSAKSLYYLSQLLPSVPRIFIVGSLKRINFDTLQYVNAVNVSSDLIEKYPNLVSWLHGSDKKIFVWAEMDESPKLWNWLINNNIDGVVTNFPATGYKYKVAKEGAKEIKIDKDATYLNKSSQTTQMNPYEPVNNKSKLHFLETVHVIASIQTSQKLYYQLGEHSFISAENLSFSLNYDKLKPFLNSRITLAPHKSGQIYQNSDHTSALSQKLIAGKKYQVLAYTGTSDNLWLKTKLGWIESKNVLFTDLPLNSFAFHEYQTSDHSFTNIQLLPFKVLKTVKLQNYFPMKNFS